MKKNRKDQQGIVLPKAFLMTLKVLEFFNPYLGMRFAAFFFSKPFRYKRPKREIPVLSSADRSNHFLHNIQKTVCCYRWKGSGPKILLVHGWSGRATQFSVIIEKLQEMDYDIYAFDAVAHGSSRGVTTNMPELIDSLKELTQKWEPEILLAHSGGGFSSVYVAAQIPEIKKMILISPFDKVTDVFEKYFQMARLGEKARELMYSYFTRVTQKEVKDFSAAKVAVSVKAKVLIIHDKNDREVDVQDANSIAKKLKNGSLLITNNLGHRRILRDEKVIEKIIEFLTKHF